MMQRRSSFEYSGGNWREYAYCKGLNPNIFFPSTEEDQLHTVKICANCVVRQECLEFALITNEKDGVWGGTTEKEREQIRKSRLAV